MKIHLKPGDRVEIRPLDYMLTHNPDVYLSRISEIQSENRIEIYMPTEKSRMILLPTGHEYETIYITSEGLFHAKIRVVERCKSGKLYTLVVDLITPIEKHQRRAYYRYACNLEVAIKALTDQEAELLCKKDNLNAEEVPSMKGVMLDVSGGGARFVAPMSLTQKGKMAIHFKLKIGGIFREYYFIGHVIQITETHTNPKLFEHRIRFHHISQSDRESIIQYIFEEERKNRKKLSGV